MHNNITEYHSNRRIRGNIKFSQ